MNGEVLAVPLTFGGTATRGTDYTTTCPSPLPDGVTCANLDSGSATVTFTGPATGATATSVTIGLGTLNANSGTNLDGGAAGTDSLGDFSISDPPAAPNNAPTVANPIPDRTATVGTAFSYAFPANTFNDPDGDALSYMATLGNGDPLPNWLGFSTRTFSGTPAAGDTGTVSIKVTANDGRGGTVSDDFRITVSDTSNADGQDSPSQPVQESLVLLGRTLGLQSVAIINDRLTSPRLPGAIGHVAGQTLTGNAIAQPATDVETGSVTGEATPIPASALETGTSFELNGETGRGSRMSLWGRGTLSSFRNGTVIDGRATTLSFGTDRRHGDTTLGVMVARSRGDIRYRDDGDGEPRTRRMTTELTAVIPYGGMDVGDDLSMWWALGIGTGSLTLKPPGNEGTEDAKADLDWHMVAGGMRGDLPSIDILPDADLTWRTDAVWTRTRTGESDSLPAGKSRGIRLRAGIGMAWRHRVAGTSVLRPHVGIDIIHDGGDGETGFGVDVTGGVDWLDPARGITVGISGHRVVHHADDAHGNWGVSVLFRYDPNPGSREGFSASAGHVVDLADPDGRGLVSGSSPAVNRNWQMEAAHGTSLGEGRVGSSYTRMNGTDDPEKMRVGYRIEPDAASAEDVTVDT